MRFVTSKFSFSEMRLIFTRSNSGTERLAWCSRSVATRNEGFSVNFARIFKREAQRRKASAPRCAYKGTGSHILIPLRLV